MTVKASANSLQTEPGTDTLDRIGQAWSAFQRQTVEAGADLIQGAADAHLAFQRLQALHAQPKKAVSDRSPWAPSVGMLAGPLFGCAPHSEPAPVIDACQDPPANQAVDALLGPDGFFHTIDVDGRHGWPKLKVHLQDGLVDPEKAGALARYVAGQLWACGEAARIQGRLRIPFPQNEHHVFLVRADFIAPRRAVYLPTGEMIFSFPGALDPAWEAIHASDPLGDACYDADIVHEQGHHLRFASPLNSIPILMEGLEESVSLRLKRPFPPSLISQPMRLDLTQERARTQAYLDCVRAGGQNCAELQYGPAREIAFDNRESLQVYFAHYSQALPDGTTRTTLQAIGGDENRIVMGNLALSDARGEPQDQCLRLDPSLPLPDWLQGGYLCFFHDSADPERGDFLMTDRASPQRSVTCGAEGAREFFTADFRGTRRWNAHDYPYGDAGPLDKATYMTGLCFLEDHVRARYGSDAFDAAFGRLNPLGLSATSVRVNLLQVVSGAISEAIAGDPEQIQNELMEGLKTKKIPLTEADFDIEVVPLCSQPTSL